MRLEGTLDAFSLPDIFQLLSYTRKTGTLHVRREAQHGVVHLRDGAVTGGRGNAACQSLGRRLVGAGLVDDEVLADAVEKVLDEPASGLAKALADTGRLDPQALQALAVEQATDAVFELLRWPDGDFAFVVDEANPDDLGARLPVDDVVIEGRRRLETWARLTAKVPSSTAVVALAVAPAGELVLTREEWALLSLVDGTRSVADLVTFLGTGEYVVVSALAALAERGLVVVGERPEGLSALVQRQQLLAALETGAVSPAAVPAAAAVVAQPEPADARLAEPADARQAEPADARQVAYKPIIPERPEPFTPDRRPAYGEEPLPALSRLARATARAAAAPTVSTVSTSTPSAPAASVGVVHGAHALQLDAVPAPSPYIDRDPTVNKSLLLRLIAGVRGL